MSGKGNCWDNLAMESFFSTHNLENDLGDNSKILLTPWERQRETAYWIKGTSKNPVTHANHRMRLIY
jgi:transposase InsO family protein